MTSPHSSRSFLLLVCCLVLQQVQGQAPVPNWQEENVCADDEWQCRTGQQCIPKWSKCNGNSNCIDNSDEWACDEEFMCPTSSESFPCEHTLCDLPGIPVCDPNQQFEYKVKVNEEIKIECKMLNKSDEQKVRWEFNTYEPGLEHLKSTDNVSEIAYLAMTPKSSFDFGSLRCYTYNETGTSCPCEYKIIQEFEKVDASDLSFFSPTQEYINIISGETLDENITCNIKFRGQENEISWWKIREEEMKCDDPWEEEECIKGEIKVHENILAKGRKKIPMNEEFVEYVEEPNRSAVYKLFMQLKNINKIPMNEEFVEYVEEPNRSAEYKLFMQFSTYVNYSQVSNFDEGVYQCRVWNPATNVTITQNVTLNVKVTCKTLRCYDDNSYCKEGVGESDAVCMCNDGYAEDKGRSIFICRDTCAVKTCPEHSQCQDNGGTSYPRCICADGYYFSDNFCYETCDIKECGRFKKCEGYGIGYCSCNDGYKYHKGKCIDQNIVDSTKGAFMSYNRLMLNSVSFVDEMYQRILEDRMDIKNIYEIILSNYIPDYENQELSCFLNKTSNDGLAQNISTWLGPVKLMSKALYTGKHALQKIFINGSIPESCNDVYTTIVNKTCGKDTCYKMFGPCLSFLDESVDTWNSLMDELNMMFRNWKYAIIKDNQIKGINVEWLIETTALKELKNKIQECAPSKDLASTNIKKKLKQYRLNLEFGNFEQYAMNHLEERVNSLKNINKNILEKVCEDFSHPTENCKDSDINIVISSNNPTPSPDVSKMLGGMAEKLKSYNEDNSVDNYIRIAAECESFEVPCSGMCIPSAFKCDGVDHCYNGLDESDQYCRRPDELNCTGGITVEKKRICDGRWDCADGSDETMEICENFCPSPYFRIGGECFLEEKRGNSWHGAKANCESKGLKLAQIHTKNYTLLKENLEESSFWVDSFFHPKEGFTWPDTGLRIDGASDAYKDPYNQCLQMFTLRNPPWTNYGDCTDRKSSLCEKENFDVADTVPLSHFGAPDGFEWIGEHLVLVPGRGTVDSADRMTWQESLEWCQQENFKPFVPATIKQWEDMRWLLRKSQHNLEAFVWLPAFDEQINDNFTWSNGEDVSDEMIDYWHKANEQDYSPGHPFKRYDWENDTQCLSLYRYSVTVKDCNRTTVPMICEYTGDFMEAKVPVQKKKEMECGEILKNITSQDIYEIDFLKIRGDEGATSHDKKHKPHDGFGYHVLTYQYWSSKRDVDLSTQPEALWYHFPVPITVVKFAFQASRERFRNEPLYSPSKYEFFGSNSKNCSDQSTWETLFVDNSGTPFHNDSHVKMETLENTKKYRCYGIKVTEVPNPRHVMISAVRMWVQKDTWFRVGGESFKLIEGDGKNWYNARGICQCLDADLAQPDDPRYLYGYLGKHGVGDLYFGHYLGATDLSNEGDWKWLNGGSVDVKFEDEALENCLHLEYKSGRKPDKYLTTVSCIGGDYARPMCEKNDVQNSGQKYFTFGLRGEYFVIVKQSLKWNDARSYCQSLGGDLAIPKDITLLRNYLFKNELIYDYWLGAESGWGREDMKWLDGEQVDFKNIPSDYIGEAGKYLDLQVSKYPSISKNIGEARSQYFICETAALMPEFVAVKGKPVEFEECGRRYGRDPFECEDGEGCFSDYERCDRNNDCYDGSDEKYCGSNEHNIFIKVDSEKFLVNETKETWQTAKKLCHSYGGYLAKPKDLLKLKNFLSENYSELSYWLGGSDLHEEGTWVWGSNGYGDPITSGWADDEPGAIIYDQNCLLFNTELDQEKSLSAGGCKNKMAYVCQYSEQN